MNVNPWPERETFFDVLEQQAERLSQRAAVEEQIAAHMAENPHLNEMQAIMALYEQGEFV